MTPPPSIARIIDVVAAYFNLTPTAIHGRNRQAHVAFARQVCMYLARERTRYSLADIGKFIGMRDHTTVIHALRAVAVALAADVNVLAQLNQLRGWLTGLPGLVEEGEVAVANP